MILDEIRKLKIEIDDLQLKVDSFTTTSAIRYDKECVQTSPSGDSLEKSVIRLIEDKDKLSGLKNKYEFLCSIIDMNKYTKRQKEFISLYYLKACPMKKCCLLMKTNYNNLCNIKKRIER
mgnify:CR=1 FL=1|jgi:hypothetical protein